ncbi:discoidin domain-containing protein [Paenibacillus dokdonensis]|uniref:Discoidin domain-containing protein n=1 Tax=Paenibacillus dokdonensis TaxID=2567944 RepID=A0ABU6GHX6_9BACL|nr:discoidin domain-containing protein [Paenibacillus dokdonensis]MEC0239349.1 discoidin domain-containing protein [Paenibacillus dokdonensis]
MIGFLKRLGFGLMIMLLVLPVIPGGKEKAAGASDSGTNLVLGKSAQASSGKAGNAVDGDAATVWQPLAVDRQDDMNVWISVDMGSEETFNKVMIHLNRADNLKDYQILYSDDGSNWNQAYNKNKDLTSTEAAMFESVSARYMKLNLNLSKDLNVQLSELAVYNSTETPAPAGLKRIYFTDASGKEYPNNAEVRLEKGGKGMLVLKGELDSGQELDLTSYAKTFIASTQDVSIEPSGSFTANQVGASLVHGVVQAAQELKTNDFWIVVDDPNAFLGESYVMNSTLTHPNMKAEIGQPAMIEPKDVYPSVSAVSNINGTLSGELIYNGSKVILQLDSAAVAKGDTKQWTPPGKADKEGRYEIRLKMEQDGKQPVYDSFYFTVWEKKKIPKDQSQIAFLGKDGKMIYVSDYRGNQILDFSNVGYMGGGVKIPEVKVKATVKPGDGDDTAHIQAAIDQVAQMPIGKDGFRGAVLLKKGKYEVGGTLKINASGIVLRGEGQDDKGTLIYGTGANPRNLIEIGENTGLSIDNSTMKTITDLYVPSGSRSFHVDDASSYQVGDTIVVRRIGDKNWIHEIGMDYIYNRPGGTATQWAPFNLDFDRVITAIDGNSITVDAPISNAIERKWGGGQIFKYTDSARIEQVGVENMRADSEFDPSVMDTTMDNGKTDPYYADEKHAERFVVFNSVKNGWMRDVTGYHLSYSLVQMSRNSKWITVQDSKMYDMVSIITGGRRYVIHQMGQLNLAQRIYTETARHAFVVDSRVQGPNVFLDGKAMNNFNTSEPHHRWSVGGLFDNIDAPISIRDRGWLGSGHGWAGANYVSWNTEDELTSQQPPTAQNYAIGHVGPKVPGLVPSDYDPRPRNDGYWESLGKHVKVESLYKQQLLERLGKKAVDNIKR